MAETVSFASVHLFLFSCSCRLIGVTFILLSGDRIPRVRFSFPASGSTPSRFFANLHLTRPIQCSILSERRVYHPYGLAGGGAAECGRNTWIKQPRKEDGDFVSSNGAITKPRTINLGGKATVKMGKGDRICIWTPGGGAWGVEGGEKKLSGKKGTHGRGDARGSVADRGMAQEAV